MADKTEMTKKDFADVLVKLSGFGIVIRGIYSASTNVISMFRVGFESPSSFGSHPYDWSIFFIPAFSIVFGSYLVRNSKEITSWLFHSDNS
jgi:hypothetical protein